MSPQLAVAQLELFGQIAQHREGPIDLAASIEQFAVQPVKPVIQRTPQQELQNHLLGIGRQAICLLEGDAAGLVLALAADELHFRKEVVEARKLDRRSYLVADHFALTHLHHRQSVLLGVMIPAIFPAIPSGPQGRPGPQRLPLCINGPLQQVILFLVGTGQVEQQEKTYRIVRRDDASRFFECPLGLGVPPQPDQARAEIDAVEGAEGAGSLFLFEVGELLQIGDAQRIPSGGELRIDRAVIDGAKLGQVDHDLLDRVEVLDLREIDGELARRVEVVDAGAMARCPSKRPPGPPGSATRDAWSTLVTRPSRMDPSAVVPPP